MDYGLAAALFARLKATLTVTPTVSLTVSLTLIQTLTLKAAGVRTTACVDLVAASGGYMLACTAHTIVAAPFAMVGSIGVIAGAPNAAQPLALPWPCLRLTTLWPCSIWLWCTMRLLGVPCAY